MKEGDKISDKLYKDMIDSLLYLTTSRPDIQLMVGICVRFQSNPKQSHLNVVKRILRYLVGAINLSLCYDKGTFCDVTGYCDANFTGDGVKRKSISGYCCFLGKFLIRWLSKRQNTIALSITEVEYVFVANYYAQILWIKY